MRLLILMVLGIAMMTSCNTENKQQTASNNNASSHHFEVAEVLQSSGYTYLFVKEKGQEYWIAVGKMDARVGDDFYYESGLEMQDFKSKELDRTFDKILFVDKISTVPFLPHQQMSTNQPTVEKNETKVAKDISVEPVTGGITIAELFKNRTNYDGKNIMVKGRVVKVNSKIMGKNWVHLQDGTKDGENYDLTITTQEEVKVDDVVTFEGLVTLNKDFGHGYSYELIVEEAKLINNSI